MSSDPARDAAPSTSESSRSIPSHPTPDEAPGTNAGPVPGSGPSSSADSAVPSRPSLRRRAQGPLAVVGVVCLVLIGVVAWRDRAAWRTLLQEPPRRTVDVESFRVPPRFDLSRTAVPEQRILGGGPPKDGIPALVSPPRVAADEAAHMSDDEPVIGVAIGGEARAYPLRILDRHEIVNEQVEDVPFAVTYCPLCDSSVVYDRRAGGETLEFGVSGLLFDSNVLMFDRRVPAGAEQEAATGRTGGPIESLWSQMRHEGISGPALGRKLRTIPCEVTTWSRWRTRHPGTTVLSDATGRPIDYGRRAYEQYFASPGSMFPVERRDDRLPEKTPVLGLWTSKGARAFRAAPFDAAGKEHEIEGELDGCRFALAFDPVAKSLRVVRADEGIEWMYAFWFAWAAFHPGTDLHVPGK